ncbi:MAG: hypothetical protein IJ529_04045 [Alphaproteobacteria bacterium]|nr:hypothetical protein [Alphaproteobacteria bacterium]MBQ9235694.1 hypothetical protein [Alphaproteobacteria bacterium]
MTNETNYAAIDLGSNSCRLLICNQKGERLLEENYATRLAQGMGKERRISAEAFGRAKEAFAEIRRHLDEWQVREENMRAITTAACRMACNSEEFIKQIKQLSGIRLEIIDGRSEAELNLQGAAWHAKGKGEYVVVWDLGGGSTEVTLATNGNKPSILRTISIPYGARNGAEDFALADYDKSKANKLEKVVDGYLDEFLLEGKLPTGNSGKVCFVATSSTPLRLVSMLEGKQEYNRREADGHIIKRAKLRELLDEIYRKKTDELAKEPCVGESRAPIFAAACVIFARIAERLGAEEIIASLKSAKDAIIVNLMERDKNNG